MSLMKYELLIVGRGGQGVLLLGRILGLAAAKYCNLYVTSCESYAAETRGGDSRVDLILASSEDELDYIKVRGADIALSLHPDSLAKFSNLLKDGSKVFIDSSFPIQSLGIRNVELIKAPYTKLAEKELKNVRVANMVALGHLVGTLKILTQESIERAIDDLVSTEWRDLNKKAFKLGVRITDNEH
jgi:2-oxoglutarate ferredoxin oxidoreductase subunit gamma